MHTYRAHSDNYFAATIADTFLSRRAYLRAPASASTESVASASMLIGADDNYHVLVRYEATYRFETPFKVVVEQDGEVVLEEVYGRRSNLKVWPFGGDRMGCGAGLVAECVWPYGATESVLWEGVGKTAYLKSGMATVTITAVHDCDDCLYANRNLDLIMLHPNSSDITFRMTADSMILPFDGLLSQHGEVFIKMTNLDMGACLQCVLAVRSCSVPFDAWFFMQWSHSRLYGLHTAAEPSVPFRSQKKTSQSRSRSPTSTRRTLAAISISTAAR